MARPTSEPVLLLAPESEIGYAARPGEMKHTSPDEEIRDLIAAHDEREMARLLLDERARVQEARSILADLLPVLASDSSGFARDALLRARAFIGRARDE